MNMSHAKKNRFRWLLAILPCVAMLCSFAGGLWRRQSPRPIQWRFAIEETLGSVQHEYALKFKELIE